MAKEKKPEEGNAAAEWMWVIRYLVVIALSLILAAALGHMSLFERTRLGRHLTAGSIVEFLGYGAAMVLSWLLARRATITVRQQGGKALAAQHLILPITSLVVVALANQVLLLLIRHFVGVTAITVINWLFIILIVACAAWLVLAVFDKAAPLTEMLTGTKDSK